MEREVDGDVDVGGWLRMGLEADLGAGVDAEAEVLSIGFDGNFNGLLRVVAEARVVVVIRCVWLFWSLRC